MKRAVVLVIGILICLQAAAFSSGCLPWTGTRGGELALQVAESRISFVGIKNNAIAVPGSFVGLRGGLDVEARRAWVEVPIDLLSTGNEERDQNIRVHYFNVRDFTLVRFSVEGVTGAEELPPVGRSVEVIAKGVLEIHGGRVPLELPVRVTREGPQRLRVQNSQPFVLTAEQLGLAQQHTILKAVCGHQALSAAVPVDLDLVFAAGI